MCAAFAAHAKGGFQMADDKKDEGKKPIQDDQLDKVSGGGTTNIPRPPTK
jgi:hypothetical protein